MTTSRDGSFVWRWLPGATEPVVAGQLVRRAGSRLSFGYGQGYLGRADAIALYHPELPLGRGLQAPAGTLEVAPCIRDASPDAWGRRVIMNRVARRGGEAGAVDELTYLMQSGSDRIGALDFQASARAYVPQLSEAVPFKG